MVTEIKKGKGGWLAKFTDTDKYQIYDRLRKLLEGSLLEKDAKKFIENACPELVSGMVQGGIGFPRIPTLLPMTVAIC